MATLMLREIWVNVEVFFGWAESFMNQWITEFKRLIEVEERAQPGLAVPQNPKKLDVAGLGGVEGGLEEGLDAFGHGGKTDVLG